MTTPPRPRSERSPAWAAVRGTWLPAVWLLGLVPLGIIVWDGFQGNLSADPITEILHRTGWWALALLVATLAVTPLRRLTGRNALVRLRRPLGLLAFFYASLHVLVYVGLDQLFAWAFLLEDVLERPYITVGFVAWLLMVPLAVTSTRGWIARLGRRWVMLHRLAYLVAVLGVVHFLWSVKLDTREPLVFAGVLALLFGYRVVLARRLARTSRGGPGGA